VRVELCVDEPGDIRGVRRRLVPLGCASRHRLPRPPAGRLLRVHPGRVLPSESVVFRVRQDLREQLRVLRHRAIATVGQKLTIERDACADRVLGPGALLLVGLAPLDRLAELAGVVLMAIGVDEDRVAPALPLGDELRLVVGAALDQVALSAVVLVPLHVVVGVLRRLARVRGIHRGAARLHAAAAAARTPQVVLLGRRRGCGGHRCGRSVGRGRRSGHGVPPG
jgi:hypothetical protein